MGRIAIIKRKVRISWTFKKTGAIEGEFTSKGNVCSFIYVTESFRRLIKILISGVNRQSRMQISQIFNAMYFRQFCFSVLKRNRFRFFDCPLHAE